jgi:hypothetical protein
MFSVTPILAYCGRIQLFGTFFGSAYPSKKHMIVFSMFIFFSSLIILYFLYDSLDKVLSIIGASSGFVLIFLIPSGINIVYYRLKHQHLIDKYESLNTLDTITTEHTEIIKQIGQSKKPYNKFKHWVFYITQIVTIFLGLFVLITQFVDIKFYTIHIN